VSSNNSSRTRSFAGVAWLLGGFVLLVLSDATAKWLTESHGVVQIVSVRAAILVTGLIIRGCLACGSVYLFIFGLRYVQLAEAAAAAYLGPVIMTGLAPIMLGERVGIHRWSAVLLGFMGMLIMLRPSADSIAWAMLLPASAAVFGALRDIVTRKMRSSGHPVAVLLYSNLIIMSVGLPFLLFVWQPFSLAETGVLFLSAALIGSAHLMHCRIVA